MASTSEDLTGSVRRAGFTRQLLRIVSSLGKMANDRSSRSRSTPHQHGPTPFRHRAALPALPRHRSVIHHALVGPPDPLCGADRVVLLTEAVTNSPWRSRRENRGYGGERFF